MEAEFIRDVKGTELYQEFMKLLIKNCYRKAANDSDDLSNQNAACLIDCIGVISVPVANMIPPTVEKKEERIKVRPTKYDFIEHAERGAIYDAARKGICLEGATMICPWVACSDCSRAIVLSGIKTVVTHKQRNEMTSLGRDKIVDVTTDRWVKPISNGMIILQEGGVEVIEIDFKAGMKVLINEQLMEV